MFSLKTKLFKVQDPRRFSYVPRYYDERKERLSDLIKKHQKESAGDKDAQFVRREINFREKTRESWSNIRVSKKEAFQQNLRLVVIIAILSLMAYYVLVKVDLVSTFFGTR